LAEEVIPRNWFSNLEEDEKFMEMESMTDQRKESILWLAIELRVEGCGLIGIVLPKNPIQ
jgi:hypothetical protein